MSKEPLYTLFGDRMWGVLRDMRRDCVGRNRGFKYPELGHLSGRFSGSRSRVYRTQSFFIVVLQKLTPPQMHERVLYHY